MTMPRPVEKIYDVTVGGAYEWSDIAEGRASANTAGSAFFEGRLYAAKDLAGLFLKEMKNDFSRLPSLVKRLNGNFCVIAKKEGRLFAAVDRIRSMPLFYGSCGNRFCISDEARSIKRGLRLKETDPCARQEFLLSGYVSGEKTLIRGIYQLQAGEYILCGKEYDEGGRGYSVKRYFIYYSDEKDRFSLDEGVKLYDELLLKVFARLRESVGARTVLIPLSAGMDSRLIAAMLRRTGFEKVICFSYGIAGNWESALSRKVAGRLGYKWLYIPYSRGTWREIARSVEWKEFLRRAGNLTSIPNVDDFPALEALSARSDMDKETVIIPGHTGDFISGGHLRYIFSEKRAALSKDAVIESIMKKHFSFWTGTRHKEAADCIRTGLEGFFKDFRFSSDQQAADAYECWEWNERQAKFIVNALRNSELRGYAWRIPLWDAELMDFWMRVPLEYKIGRELYKGHMKTHDGTGVFGDAFKRKSLHKRSRAGRLKRYIGYFRDPKGVGGIYGYPAVTFLNPEARGVNSLLAKECLEESERAL